MSGPRRKRIASFALETLRFRDRIGKKLDLAARGDPAQPVKFSEQMHETRSVVRDTLPLGRLLLAVKDASHLHAPDTQLPRLGKTQLRQGDGDLGRPPFLVDVDGGLPDRVPAVVRMISVLGQNVIRPNARAVDVEDEGRLMIEVAVEEDLHLVTLAIVATRNAALDEVGLAVISANGDIGGSSRHRRC